MTPDHTDSADPARTPAGSGAPKGGAEGVLSAVRPDLHQTTQCDQEPVFLGVHIVAPPDWSAPTSATATCPCGYQRSARGRAAVLSLVEDYTEHKETTCPRLAGIAERRDAA
ncbi:hypothetical protein AB0G85_21865 [Streptomyces sioyaensis]|uniref:hypothetical protein n=1 Tax=Streptomyces sioyaensis TaxID=67364 RepID=UPI0033CC8DE2